VDVLALMGDTSDNIPGVPGIGEKTAMKLIRQYGTLDNLLTHVGELTGRARQTLETHREQALLSRRLATIICDVPLAAELDALKVRPFDEEKLKGLLVEFEFNSIGRRIFGEGFKAGRGGGMQKEEGSRQNAEVRGPKSEVRSPKSSGGATGEQLVLVAEEEGRAGEDPKAAVAPAAANLKSIADVPHEYHLVATAGERAKLIKTLQGLDSFCFDTETTSLDPKDARVVGLAFSFAPHQGYYVPMLQDGAAELRAPHSPPSAVLLRRTGALRTGKRFGATWTGS
jgi:DNA polymerase-1